MNCSEVDSPDLPRVLKWVDRANIRETELRIQLPDVVCFQTGRLFFRKAPISCGSENASEYKDRGPFVEVNLPHVINLRNYVDFVWPRYPHNYGGVKLL